MKNLAHSKNFELELAAKPGQEIVVVMGLGFVGTAVVANLVRTRFEGNYRFFVVGLDQDNPQGQEKCARLNRGQPPVYATDTALETTISQAFHQGKNVLGTVNPAVLASADVVVVCLNLDLERDSGQTESLAMNTEGYARALRIIGEKIRPGTLVTVESTLPIGMCDTILYPALCEGQRQQGIDPSANPPLLAFCYERVMPGPDYLDSVNNYWRAYAGINEESSERAKQFLSSFVNTAQYPLWGHKSTRAAEMAKLLENSYRATNIAFIEEWAELAEGAGVDLFDVISSVRVRKGTHDNMMRPGLGVGGYCLTKDALLAAYGAEKLLNIPAALPFSRLAILTNERMPLRALDWIRAHFKGNIAGKKALLLGVTYRPGVADTRSSATEILARELLREHVQVVAYDPLVTVWEEVPQVPVTQDPRSAIEGAAVVVICLPDPGYLAFLRPLLTQCLKAGALVVDPWNMVGDQLANELDRLDITLRVYGRGDIPTSTVSA